MEKLEREAFQSFCNKYGYNCTIGAIELTPHYNGWKAGIEFEKERSYKEVEKVLSYDTGATGHQAEDFLKSMPSMRKTHSLHSIGILIRGLFYRGHTAGKGRIKADLEWLLNSYLPNAHGGMTMGEFHAKCEEIRERHGIKKYV